MCFLKRLHPDFALPRAHIDTADEPDHFVFFGGLFPQRLHVGVEVRETLQELRGALRALQRFGDEALHGEAARAIDSETRDAG